MRKTVQPRPCLQREELLTTSVTREPRYAEVLGTTGLTVTGCAGSIRFSTARIIAMHESSSRKGQEACPFGTDTSDESLIEAVCQGDRRAMALLYRRHHVQVYRFALRLTRDATVAEDIVSDVFLEVWRRAEWFKARAQVSTWLLGIARNMSFSAMKRRSGQQLDPEAMEVMEIEDPADDPEVLAHKANRSEAIRMCLSQLSAAQREVIDLVYYHEKSVGDVAKIVGVPASTVKTRMFYARQRMRKILEAAGHDR